MAYEIRFVVPDWLASQAIDAIRGLPVLIGDDPEQEYLGRRPEDALTGPEEECLCPPGERPYRDCPIHGVRVLPVREPV